jgi:hypothetical protein
MKNKGVKCSNLEHADITPWPLARKQTIPTERSPLVGEVGANSLRIEGVTWSAQRIPTVVNLGFLDRSRYFSIHEAAWTPFQITTSQEVW